MVSTTLEQNKAEVRKIPLGHMNGNTTEDAIVEMMLKSVHSIKGKLIQLEEKLIKACSS